MAANDVFCLRLQDFDSNIKDSWKEIQSQRDFCDVTLACDNKQIETHKFIISSSSPVFRNILKQNSNHHPFIYLRGVKYKDLSNLLNFMYQGEVNIPQEELNSFLAVAEDLKIIGLSEDQTKECLNEKQQSSQEDTFDDKNYVSPKRKFIKKLDDNKFCNSFISGHKNVIGEQNDKNQITENGEVNMEFRNETSIVKHPDSEFHPVSTSKNNTNDSGLYSCNNCEKQFSSSSNLYLHVKSIHDGIHYSCNQCDYKATLKGNLKRHIQSVHEIISYPCHHCDYKATQTSNLKTHLTKYHS